MLTKMFYIVDHFESEIVAIRKRSLSPTDLTYLERVKADAKYVAKMARSDRAVCEHDVKFLRRAKTRLSLLGIEPHPGGPSTDNLDSYYDLIGELDSWYSMVLLNAGVVV